jgi:uncharacterized small protein (DUF1192 family)
MQGRAARAGPARRLARMELDDLEPRKKPVQAKDLSGFSLAELEQYIERLRAEIARAEAMIQSKRAHRGGADALFKR